ncbi:hypothetical protein AB0L00_25265 [Actinoallomurus sp. NPDC052308]|uniref:hypothetical protein n=1 Tax=Actinoallomurus sp. NPDC052308 TaxID=3155530 RepID=UPI00343C97FE
MPKNPDSPNLKQSVPVDLPGGRKAKIYVYDNGEVGFHLTDGPWVLSQCFLPGDGQPAEIRLSPGKQGSGAYSNWFEGRMKKINAAES